MTVPGDLRRLTRNPLFWAGLALRAALVALLLPIFAEQHYVPFMQATAERLSIDPWHVWTESGGDLHSFPYGTVMWIIFLPAFKFAAWFSVSGMTAYLLTLFVAEMMLLLLLLQIAKRQMKNLILLFWLSPIALTAIYVYGFNDIIPITFLTGTALCIRTHRWHAAGILLAAAISAKLSMIVALPLLALYMVNNPPMHRFIRPAAFSFVGAAALFHLPFLLSTSGPAMLFGNPEMTKVSQVRIPLLDNELLLIPFALCAAPLLGLARAAHQPRYSVVAHGLGFFGVGAGHRRYAGMDAVEPAAAGLVPKPHGRPLCSARHFVGSLLHGLCLVCRALFPAKRAVVDLTAALPLPAELRDIFEQTLLTFLICLGTITGLRIWREAVMRDGHFRLSRRPLMLAVAGDPERAKILCRPH